MFCRLFICITAVRSRMSDFSLWVSSSHFKWTPSSQWSKNWTLVKPSVRLRLLLVLCRVCFYSKKTQHGGQEINQTAEPLLNILYETTNKTVYSKFKVNFHVKCNFLKSTGNTNTFQISALAWSATHQHLRLTPQFINMQSYSSSYKNQVLTKDKE